MDIARTFFFLLSALVVSACGAANNELPPQAHLMEQDPVRFVQHFVEDIQADTGLDRYGAYLHPSNFEDVKNGKGAGPLMARRVKVENPMLLKTGAITQDSVSIEKFQEGYLFIRFPVPGQVPYDDIYTDSVNNGKGLVMSSGQITINYVNGRWYVLGHFLKGEKPA
ncbi:hypothetical protein [Gallaecimonas sp. GXIMD4217]|uniref:hypothetical protein n=1 Tax=Gallaecimonas sp. GXIMD4217 TaxID=3131927 RepID=UPI00311AC659